MQKTQILDQFIAVSGYHRKHAIRLLSGETGSNSNQSNSCKMSRCRRIYDDAVKEALIVLWEAADRICGKRLKAVLPDFVEAMERHGHLNLDPEVRKQLLKVSAATIDRLLSPIRNPSQSRRKRRRSTKVGKQVPVRTFADWDGPNPGYLEVDFVVHCGGFMTGSFIHTSSRHVNQCLFRLWLPGQYICTVVVTYCTAYLFSRIHSMPSAQSINAFSGFSLCNHLPFHRCPMGYLYILCYDNSLMCVSYREHCHQRSAFFVMFQVYFAGQLCTYGSGQ